MKRKLLSPLALIPATTAFTPHIHHHDYQHHQNPKSNQITQLHLQLEPTIPIAAAAAAIGTWYILSSPSRQIASQSTKQYQTQQLLEHNQNIPHIDPKPTWTTQELSQYNGSDPTRPILMAVKGDVFNVWKGRNFYGEGGEYHIMAGRDATRFLAKNRLEEESEEEASLELNVGERANLEMWYWTIKNKYEFVGQLEGYDPKTTEM